MFTVLSSLILAVFVVVAIIHLVRCYQLNLGLSDITKFFLMPLLAVFYIIACFPFPFTTINVLVLCALLFFWIGDILLIYDWERPSFFFGILTFFLAQIALIVVAIILFQSFSFNILLGILIAIIYIIILAIKLIFLRKPFEFIGLQVLATCYLISTTVLSFLLLMLAIATPNVYTILMAIGGICFMLSDYHVIQEYYIGGTNLSRFWIMLGYLIGTCLIVVGCAGMQSLLATV
ncbi:MAG: hypothetical protein IJU92_06500 [Spirochaetaceae bacterium]|nr:hypothetical protein [Spirochaetaceae bacterium]